MEDEEAVDELRKALLDSDSEDDVEFQQVEEDEEEEEVVVKKKKSKKKTKKRKKEKEVPKRRKRAAKRRAEAVIEEERGARAMRRAKEEEGDALAPFGGRDGDSEAEEEGAEDEWNKAMQKMKKGRKKDAKMTVMVVCIRDVQNVGEVERQVKEFIERMDVAVEADRLAIEEEKGVVSRRLRLLPELQLHTKKRLLQDVFVNCGILPVLRKWLEPLPDGSMVSPVLTKALLDVLRLLPVSEEFLQQSGVGQVVMFIFKRSPDSQVQRQAQMLLERWTRPIFKKSSNWNVRFLKKDVGKGVLQDLVTQQSNVERPRLQSKDYFDEADAYLKKKKKTEEEEGHAEIDDHDPLFTAHARLPAPLSMDFSRPPTSKPVPTKRGGERHVALKNKLDKMKRKKSVGSKHSKLSVAGSNFVPKFADRI